MVGFYEPIEVQSSHEFEHGINEGADREYVEE